MSALSGNELVLVKTRTIGPLPSDATMEHELKNVLEALAQNGVSHIFRNFCRTRRLIEFGTICRRHLRDNAKT